MVILETGITSVMDKRILNVDPDLGLFPEERAEKRIPRIGQYNLPDAHFLVLPDCHEVQLLLPVTAANCQLAFSLLLSICSLAS